jgi:DNA-binding MarR family transcriptional regulator
MSDLQNLRDLAVWRYVAVHQGTSAEMLEADLGIEIATVRLALDILAARGLIERVRVVDGRDRDLWKLRLEDRR